MVFRLSKEFLKRSVAKHGIANQVEAARILEICSTVLEAAFGPKIKKQAKPLYYKNKVIHLSVTSSVVATEIKLHQENILKQINKKAETTQAVSTFRFLT